MRSPRRNLTTLGYRRIIRLLVYLVSVPGVLLSAVGVLLFVLGLGEARYNLLLGILILTFCGTAATGVTLVWVFLRREWNLSELQADFVSKVSHELRTPLTSIRMFSETLALRRGDKATEDRCIEALSKECARLQHLIDRLLDWGRMESGRRTYDMGPHDVQTIVDESIAAFEPTRERRDVELNISVRPDLPPVFCDKSALVDCLVNLLSNAYKYSGNPRVIDISAEVQQKLIHITVHDNGKGIERKEHKRIFEKFYRVDDLLSRKQEGSGLGLSIVRHVVKAHRGKIIVDSEPGRGSAFTLMLPIATAPSAKTSAPKTTPTDRPPPPEKPEPHKPRASNAIALETMDEHRT
ncbi:MAG: HAMP domain-containing histidine kinase [Polyangiaceae bacterium]|nr:HAMP domain-containing histidine kinase [Polyangiaceae bacterium]NUQ76767.1 HAMP domain-containing histidine kinase [Polyangiaceae bacterium]